MRSILITKSIKFEKEQKISQQDCYLFFKYRFENIMSSIISFYKKNFDIDIGDVNSWKTDFFFINYSHFYLYKEADNVKEALQLHKSLNQIRAGMENLIFNRCQYSNEKWPFGNLAGNNTLVSNFAYHRVPKALLEKKCTELDDKQMYLEEPEPTYDPNDIETVHDYLDSVTKYHIEDDELTYRIDELYSFLHPEYKNFSYAPEFDSLQDTLYIYRGDRIKCHRENHNVICVNAMVSTMHNEKATININFCTDCFKFFINYTEYCRYIRLYDVIYVYFGKVDSNGEFVKNQNIEEMSSESPLKMCGYSVEQKKNLSKPERQQILQNIMVKHIMSKPSIIRYLNWFMEYLGRKEGMALAVSKWDEDLTFVENFDKENQFNVNIERISRY